VEVVRQAIEALNRRDADALLEGAEPDLVQDWSRSIGPERGIFRGSDQVKQFLRSWWDAFDETFIDVEEFIDAGDQVVAVFHARNRGRGSGIEVEGRGAVLVWTLRNGKIISTTLYQERADALEAVGRAE
jgi:ketosteroid isomerase-like protein